MDIPMGEILVYPSEHLGGTQFSIYSYEKNMTRTVIRRLMPQYFEKVLSENRVGLDSEQPRIYIYINLVRDHSSKWESGTVPYLQAEGTTILSALLLSDG